MFSKIDRLDELLTKLSAALETTEKKRFTASQAFKAENLNLAEGATLNIQMNNMIFSVEIIAECLQIVNELKCFLPIQNKISLNETLQQYKNIVMAKALKKSEYHQGKAAKILGISRGTLKYWMKEHRPDLQKRNLISNE